MHGFNKKEMTDHEFAAFVREMELSYFDNGNATNWKTKFGEIVAVVVFDNAEMKREIWVKGPKLEIHVAYSYSPRTKTYFAASYLLESNHAGLPIGHSFKSALRCAIGDSRIEAERETLSRTIEFAAYPDADSIPVINHGRKSVEMVQGHLFP